jgi:hypothetical protein
MSTHTQGLRHKKVDGHDVSLNETYDSEDDSTTYDVATTHPDHDGIHSHGDDHDAALKHFHSIVSTRKAKLRKAEKVAEATSGLHKVEYYRDNSLVKREERSAVDFHSGKPHAEATDRQEPVHTRLNYRDADIGKAHQLHLHGKHSRITHQGKNQYQLTHDHDPSREPDKKKYGGDGGQGHMSWHKSAEEALEHYEKRSGKKVEREHPHVKSFLSETAKKDRK